MNLVLQTIQDRYSCRSYTGEMPSAEKLEAVARAATQAPSAMNRQRWRVIVVKNKALMDEMEAEGMKILAAMPDKTLHERVVARGGRLYYNAPCMILAPIEAAEPVGASLDCGILCQNITLAAASLGLGSLICGLAGLAFAGDRAADFKARLGFPPGYEFGAAVLLGKAQQQAPPHEPDPGKISFVE